ncbi:TVP38/TMEM64 family protein [bacterium]|jgi:uncharacterized membrane protein YdjX (TVP38/TMEM64 family)|nr:TVP38/TMEM64 family protein [bacterium]
MRKFLKFGLIFFLVLVVGLVLKMGWVSHLSLDSIKANQSQLSSFYTDHQFLFIFVYMMVYIMSAALSLPGATVLSLLGGALFGALLGSVIVIFSATVGASLAFLSARFIFRDFLEEKYKSTLYTFNEKLKDNDFQYLLFLRLVPAFPFFLINLVMGLTRMRLRTFFLGSAIGMFPGSFVFCNAGKQLSSISSFNDFVSVQLLIAFSLLGCLALAPSVYTKLKSK